MALFLLSFRIWDNLRQFLNNYFNGDLVQGLFVLWILACALFFGNNCLEAAENYHFDYLIGTYLVVKGSFWGMETIYAIFIPELRSQYWITHYVQWPSVALLIGAMNVNYWPTKTALVIPTMVSKVLSGLTVSLHLPIASVQYLTRIMAD